MVGIGEVEEGVVLEEVEVEVVMLRESVRVQVELSKLNNRLEM